MQQKIELLKELLLSFEKVAIAFSGGVDSTFLLAIAKEVLADGVIALTARAPAFSQEETEEASLFCKEHQIQQIMVDLDWNDLEIFLQNPPERCYYCKKSIFHKLKTICEQQHTKVLADGTNADDENDYRPGMRALREMGIRSPLQEVGLSKEEIRAALRARGLNIWQKPAYACLATRVPFGEPITETKLRSIEAVERELHKLGFLQVRVRYHGEARKNSVARIEVLPEERQRFIAEEGLMDRVNEIALKNGFQFAALDLAGYRMGKMNPEKDKLE